MGADIGSYRIVRRLALGERSEVLLARVHGPYGFQRTVVLKRLIGSHARDPQWLRRLAAEAIAYARLSHSAIVRLYDFVDLDGTPALVLEYVPGISLESLVRIKRDRGTALGDAEILYIGARVFAALAAAHGARNPETGEFSPVIHRDVSPGNVLVSTHGEVKLSDFGIARVAGVTDETPAGTLLGTYGYMAPEQIVGDPITVRADVYGASLLLWELFAGRHAFERESLPELEILQAMAQPRIPPIERLRPDLPPAVCEALGRALRAEPDERIGARDMLEVLRVHVQSADARASLADDLGRARRPLSTIPDPPVARAWTAYAAAIDPDATSDAPLPAVTDAPEPTPTPTERPPPPPPPRARLDSDTPTAIAVPLPPPVPVLPPPPVTAPSRGARSALRRVLGYLALAAVVLAPLLAPARVAVPAAASAPIVEVPPARTFVEPPPGDRLDAPPRGESPSPLPDDMGLLETPNGMANHRVFVDGLVRGSGGVVVRLRCGRHEIRLGSAGRLQGVDVPCGGRIRVDP